MKRLLFASSLFFSISCFAQDQIKIAKAPSPAVQVFMGYLIKLNSLAGGYGYDILSQGKVIISQKQNPFTLSPKGLSNSADAFKIARWQVQQLVAGTPPSVVFGQHLPSPLAKQLNISLE